MKSYLQSPSLGIKRQFFGPNKNGRVKKNSTHSPMTEKEAYVCIVLITKIYRQKEKL